MSRENLILVRNFDSMRDVRIRVHTGHADLFIESLVEAAKRSSNSAELGTTDCDPNFPYDSIKEKFEKAIEKIEELRNHAHQFGEDDYCAICGQDGRT